MYLISVYFDEETNKVLKKLIKEVAIASGNTFMIDNNVPPHMTVAAVETKDEKKLKEKFEELKGKFNSEEKDSFGNDTGKTNSDKSDSGKIDIVSVGQLFPYVIYVIPVLNKYLQGLVQEVYDILNDIPEIKQSRYYMPYSWLPHITIGKKLSKDEMVKAFEVLQKYFVPIKASVVYMGLAKTNPYEEIVGFELSD